MPAFLKERFAAARAGDPLAVEQAQLRLTIVTLIGIYFAVMFLRDRVLDDIELLLLVLYAVTFVLGAAHLGWMLVRPGVDHPRRRVSVLLDMAALTLGMLLGDETGVMLYGVYLWVVIGNGFRFGRWYLHFAQLVSLVGFTTVLFFSEFWRQHTTLGAALFLTLLAVPWYVSLLIARLNAASERLQEARHEAEAANSREPRPAPADAGAFHVFLGARGAAHRLERAARGARNQALGHHARADVRQPARHLED
jgi:two-component system sensor histidine kinase RpfC